MQPLLTALPAVEEEEEEEEEVEVEEEEEDIAEELNDKAEALLC